MVDQNPVHETYLFVLSNVALLLLILAHVNSKLAALRLKFSHVFLYSPLQFNISNILLPLKLVSAIVRQCSASGSFLDHNVQHSRR